MSNEEMKILEFIRAEKNRNWDSSVGFKWKDLNDAEKLAILNLRETNIICIASIQGEYIFCREV